MSSAESEDVAQTWKPVVYRVWYELAGFLDDRRDPILSQLEILAGMGPFEPVADAVAVARAQKIVLGLLKSKLEADPALAHRFVAQPGWPWLAKLVALIRLKELAGARIVQRGARAQASFDCTELVRTHHGKALMRSLGFERRKILTKAELAKLEEACAQIKLTLPRIIEPTTTERFFSADAGSGDAADGDSADAAGGDSADEST